MTPPLSEHHCQNIDTYDLDKFFQRGIEKGSHVLIVGESPAPNGWRISGKACYTTAGKLLPTGQRLNELLKPFNLSVEVCGFTELAKCFVGKDRKLLYNCAKTCWPIFIKQLRKNDIKIIIFLGVKTLEIFNKLNQSNLIVGKLATTEIAGRDYSILPIYHPSPINPTGRAKNLTIFTQNKTKLVKYTNTAGSSNGRTPHSECGDF